MVAEAAWQAGGRREQDASLGSLSFLSPFYPSRPLARNCGGGTSGYRVPQSGLEGGGGGMEDSGDPLGCPMARESLVSRSYWASGAEESLCPAEWPRCSPVLGRAVQKGFYLPTSVW